MKNIRRQKPFNQEELNEFAQAIYTVNRHAKTAPDPKFLYSLKKTALEKLVLTGNAKKKGLHFSRNHKKSQQQSSVLIECGNYSFHIPPTKEDIVELPHLGDLDNEFHNEKIYYPLSKAKKLLSEYTGIKEPQAQKVDPYAPFTGRMNPNQPTYQGKRTKRV